MYKYTLNMNKLNIFPYKALGIFFGFLTYLYINKKWEIWDWILSPGREILYNPLLFILSR